jgi:hypothetical protein
VNGCESRYDPGGIKEDFVRGLPRVRFIYRTVDNRRFLLFFDREKRRVLHRAPKISDFAGVAGRSSLLKGELLVLAKLLIVVAGCTLV